MIVEHTTKMWFGKHKGLEMQKVPASYLLYIYHSSNKTDNDFMWYVYKILEDIKERAEREKK